MKKIFKKGIIKEKFIIASIGIVTLLPTGIVVFAEEGDTDFNFISSAINTATKGLKSEAAVVIGSGIALGLVFWGAKLLWGKFKSMAK